MRKTEPGEKRAMHLTRELTPEEPWRKKKLLNARAAVALLEVIIRPGDRVFVDAPSRLAGPFTLTCIYPCRSLLLRRRQPSENLKLQIDHRTRQLIRNTCHPVVDIARRKHRQHLIAKLLD